LRWQNERNESKDPRSINNATRMEVADNTGARIVEVISVLKYRGVKNRLPRGGIGDTFIVSVKKEP